MVHAPACHFCDHARDALDELAADTPSAWRDLVIGLVVLAAVAGLIATMMRIARSCTCPPPTRSPRSATPLT
ncbi:hypothetical protein ACFQX7_29080 [Luedemannella flava]